MNPRFPILILLLSCLTGCGRVLILGPYVERLDPDTQKSVDRIWNNMLTPANRVDRSSLLAVVCIYHLHEMGVDSLSLHSEKSFDSGRIAMDIAYNRTDPTADHLEVKVYDRDGRLTRCESYTAPEIQEQLNDLAGPRIASPAPTTTQPALNVAALSPEDQARLQAWKDRWITIAAATQPAGWTPPADFDAPDGAGFPVLHVRDFLPPSTTAPATQPDSK